MAALEIQPPDLYQEDPSETRFPDISQRLDQAIFASQPLEQVLDLILDEALGLTGARCGSLRLVNYRNGGRLVSKAIRLAGGTSIAPESQVDLPLHGNSVVARVVRDKQPYLLNDLTQASHVHLDPHTPMLSELAVPIFSSDANAIVGVLNVESPVCNAFSERHKQWLQDLALRAQMVIQRARLSDAHQTIARKVLEMKLDALLAYTSPPYTFFLLNGDMELHR